MGYDTPLTILARCFQKMIQEISPGKIPFSLKKFIAHFWAIIIFWKHLARTVKGVS